jgi:phosphatidylglycerol lysyltransferase
MADEPIVAGDAGIDEVDDTLAPALPRTVVGVLRRIPFTLSVVGVMLVLGLATTSLWRALEDQALFQNVAYGLPAFAAGRVYTLVTGSLFALTPAQYLPVAGGFLLLAGWSEWRLGTRRAAIAVVVAQSAGILGAALLLWAVGGVHSGWPWAARISDDLDVGFSAGAMGAVAAASVTLLPPWRARLRFVLGLYAVIAFLYIGVLWDLEHLIGVSVGFLLGPFLVGRRPELRRLRMSRREWRSVAAGLFLVAAIIRVVLLVVPADGPLGAADSEDVLTVAVSAGISLLLANGLRKGRHTSWVWAMVFTFLVAAILAVALVLLTIIAIVDPKQLDGAVLDTRTGATIPSAVVSLLLWLVQAVVLVRGRHAFRAVSSRKAARLGSQDDVDRADGIALLHRIGGGSLSWMGTWTANRWFVLRDADGMAVGAQAYQPHRGVGVALGDPVGPDAATRARVLDAFVDRQVDLGQRFCLFSVTTDAVDWADSRGFRHVQVAEEAVIDLPGLEFKGKEWQATRSALNRGAKEGVQYVEGALAQMPRSVLAQVRTISEVWVGDKGLPEMGFTLGGVDEALDLEVRCGLAVDADGRVHGVTSWLPAYGADGVVEGWTLDVMRRLPDGFKPVTEFLIASACLAFRDSGAQWVSLSGAPLAHSEEGELGGLTRLLDRLGELLEPLYGFRSLDAFKAKFQPRHVPMFMVFRDEAALPRISLALTEAYLPDASTADLAKAGFDALIGAGAGAD